MGVQGEIGGVEWNGDVVGGLGSPGSRNMWKGSRVRIHLREGARTSFEDAGAITGGKSSLFIFQLPVI